MAKENYKLNPWWIATAVCAFASFISFAQINSYWADRNNFNGFFGWLGIGIVFLVLTVFFLYKTATTSSGRGG